jgi:hypothetical protein
MNDGGAPSRLICPWRLVLGYSTAQPFSSISLVTA